MSDETKTENYPTFIARIVDTPDQDRDGSTDAYIFANYVQQEVKNLTEIAKEIDERYSQ